MVTLLPESDSPTMPSTSPSSSLTSTLFTACITPAVVGKSTERFSMSSSAMSLSLQLRIEGVAQAVAQQIEGEHGDQDGEAGEGDDPPCPLDEFPPVGQQRAPFPLRPRRAAGKKAQRPR